MPLRAKAITEAIFPFELGRAIFHLAQRRGFKSNRKEIINNASATEEETKNKKEKAIDKISDQQKRDNLQSEIAKNNYQTLGKYLFKHRLSQGLNARALADYDVLYPTREMYLQEFLTIKKFQQPHHNISEESWQKIESIIFFQRKLKVQDKGFCRFLNIHKLKEGQLPQWATDLLQKNSNESLPRAYLAMPSYCLFRILSEVNNLKLKNIATREQIELSLEQKQKLINKLNSQKSPVKFSVLKKELNTKETSYQHDYEFNLESERRLDLQANPTLNLLANEKYFGNLWQQFSLAKQDEIVEFLLEEDAEEKIENKALNEWQVLPEQAKNLSKLTINNFQNTGVGSMCKEILQQLCEAMQAQNCRYDEALKFLGINHSNENYGNGEADFLPYYASAIPTSVVEVKTKSASQEEQDYGKIANPTVHVALNQIRKVVNDIIKNHGKPAQIYVELARELKQTKQQKKQTEEQQKANEKENKEAKQILAENNIPDNYENLLRYKLWKELDFKDVNNRKCPYSGKTISIEKLFSAEFEIEHILPFSQTLDDSIANKTIASKSANAFKGNRSPFEAFASSASYNYPEILQRTKTMPKHKRWRFEPEAMKKFADQNSFLASQLNDTRYISRVAKQYLQQICPKDNIKIGNGKVTAILRHNWGLNSLLKNIDFDPETGEVLNNQPSQNQNSGKQNSGKKNRQDHRHHAIDAVCIALTDQGMLQKISRDNAKNFDINKLEIQLPNHWNSFREDVKEIIDKIIVSHKIDHNKNVKLHDETNYGILHTPEKIKEKDYNVVYRKKFSTLTFQEIEKIRDQKIKNDLLAKLTGYEKDKQQIKIVLANYQINNKKIRSIRILKPENRINIITHNQNCLNKNNLKEIECITHKKGVASDNSHIEIWQLPKKNFEFFTILKYKETSKKYKDLLKSFSVEKYEQFLDFLKNKNGRTMCKNFDDFKNENDFWVSDDFNFAVICPTNLNNARKNIPKPHPAAKLICKLYKGDSISFNNKNSKIIANIAQLAPSSNRIILYLHNEASKDDKKQIRLTFSDFKDSKLTKLFVSPSGKVFDNGPIFKE